MNTQDDIDTLIRIQATYPHKDMRALARIVVRILEREAERAAHPLHAQFAVSDDALAPPTTEEEAAKRYAADTIAWAGSVAWEPTDEARDAVLAAFERHAGEWQSDGEGPSNGAIDDVIRAVRALGRGATAPAQRTDIDFAVQTEAEVLAEARTERDAAREERDALRARLAKVEAELADVKDLFDGGNDRLLDVERDLGTARARLAAALGPVTEEECASLFATGEFHGRWEHALKGIKLFLSARRTALDVDPAAARQALAAELLGPVTEGEIQAVWNSYYGQGTRAAIDAVLAARRGAK